MDAFVAVEIMETTKEDGMTTESTVGAETTTPRMAEIQMAISQQACMTTRRPPQRRQSPLRPEVETSSPEPAGDVTATAAPRLVDP